MTGSRRLSQAISEGDGISVLVQVASAAAAAEAEAQGAEGLVLDARVPGVREASGLPILFRGGSPEDAAAAGADAWLLVAEGEDGLEGLYARAQRLGLECVVDVHDEEELRAVLERIDPEIVLLSPREAGAGEALERVLDLLPDIPAGKLAIAELEATTREEVAALERAGVDAVLVGPGDVSGLIAGPPPAV